MNEQQKPTELQILRAYIDLGVQRGAFNLNQTAECLVALNGLQVKLGETPAPMEVVEEKENKKGK